MSFDSEKPYDNLPLLPPKVEIEARAILRKAISAGRALAKLKGLARQSLRKIFISIQSFMRFFQNNMSLSVT